MADQDGSYWEHIDLPYDRTTASATIHWLPQNEQPLVHQDCLSRMSVYQQQLNTMQNSLLEMNNTTDTQSFQIDFLANHFNFGTHEVSLENQYNTHGFTLRGLCDNNIQNTNINTVYQPHNEEQQLTLSSPKWKPFSSVEVHLPPSSPYSTNKPLSAQIDNVYLNLDNSNLNLLADEVISQSEFAENVEKSPSIQPSVIASTSFNSCVEEKILSTSKPRTEIKKLNSDVTHKRLKAMTQRREVTRLIKELNDLLPYASCHHLKTPRLTTLRKAYEYIVSLQEELALLKKNQLKSNSAVPVSFNEYTAWQGTSSYNIPSFNEISRENSISTSNQTVSLSNKYPLNINEALSFSNTQGNVTDVITSNTQTLSAAPSLEIALWSHKNVNRSSNELTTNILLKENEKKLHPISTACQGSYQSKSTVSHDVLNPCHVSQNMQSKSILNQEIFEDITSSSSPSINNVNLLSVNKQNENSFSVNGDKENNVNPRISEKVRKANYQLRSKTKTRGDCQIQMSTIKEQTGKNLTVLENNRSSLGKNNEEKENARYSSQIAILGTDMIDQSLTCDEYVSPPNMTLESNAKTNTVHFSESQAEERNQHGIQQACDVLRHFYQSVNKHKDDKIENTTSLTQNLPKRRKRSKSEDQEKRIKKKKIVELEKKSMNGYMFYSMVNRPKLKIAYPELNSQEISKLLGVLWTQNSDQTKEEYRIMAVIASSQLNKQRSIENIRN